MPPWERRKRLILGQTRILDNKWHCFSGEFDSEIDNKIVACMMADKALERYYGTKMDSRPALALLCYQKHLIEKIVSDDFYKARGTLWNLGLISQEQYRRGIEFCRGTVNLIDYERAEFGNPKHIAAQKEFLRELAGEERCAIIPTPMFNWFTMRCINPDCRKHNFFSTTEEQSCLVLFECVYCGFEYTRRKNLIFRWRGNDQDQ